MSYVILLLVVVTIVVCLVALLLVRYDESDPTALWPESSTWTWMCGRIWKSPTPISPDHDEVEFPERKYYIGVGDPASFWAKMIWHQVSDLIPDMLDASTPDKAQNVLLKVTDQAQKIGVTFQQVIRAINEIDTEYNRSWH